MQPSSPQRRSRLRAIFFSPDEVRLRAGWRIAAHTVLLVFFIILASPLLIPFIWSSPQGLLFGAQVVAFFAITLATFIARRRIDRRTILSLGLVWDRQAAWDIAVGIFISGLVLSLVFVTEWSMGLLRVESLSLQTQTPGTVLVGLGLMFLIFVIVGWQEELLSRGYWLQNLEDGLRLPGALLVSSIWFALAHLANPNISFLGVLGLIAAGLFLAYGYLATRQLWLPIGLHIGWNFFEGPIFGFPVSGSSSFSRLLVISRSGSDILTGGAFGPEAGLIQYPVLLLAVLIIQRYCRGRTASKL